MGKMPDLVQNAIEQLCNEPNFALLTAAGCEFVTKTVENNGGGIHVDVRTKYPVKISNMGNGYFRVTELRNGNERTSVVKENKQD